MPASRSGPAAAASKSAMQTDPALLQPPPATLTITAASKDASFDAAAQSQSPLPAEFDWMGWLPRLSRLDVHIKRLIIRGSRTEKEVRGWCENLHTRLPSISFHKGRRTEQLIFLPCLVPNVASPSTQCACVSLLQ
eukprot:scaffold206692_cov14-Tisochrysis_lutea.AAC.2